MKKAITLIAVLAVVLGVAFTPRASGQTVQLTPASHTERALPGISVSWYSGLTKKMVMMRVENTSGENINAYNMSIGFKYADGSTDYSDGHFSSERMEMFQVVGMNGIEPQSFVAGTNREQLVYQGDKEVTGVEAVPDVIVYTDDTAEVRNERAFKQIMAMRKGELLGLQRMSEVISVWWLTERSIRPTR